ncbi:hypothetical protein [Janthinobacterium sp.]|uniref:hypothetical protein n=1 Tax=Janthinobacterium sp. TaxID=1871054 RepID=UPI00293D7388|nr:hypothetical protein [Janthinobacterium sp.]
MKTSDTKQGAQQPKDKKAAIRPADEHSKGPAGSQQQGEASNKQSATERANLHTEAGRSGSNQQRAEAGQHSGKDKR